ncbi:MAG: hypothetical protein KDA24_24060, partial [Deltaproteobacteria bacterium]|nr:hypothetical protein [Deltaproteobacteria bacterium]
DDDDATGDDDDDATGDDDDDATGDDDDATADDDDSTFEGGYPVNNDLSGCNAQNFGPNAGVGDELPCVDITTQFDEQYNLWNLRGSADYLVVDVCAMWAGPCQLINQWRQTGNGYFQSGDYDGVWEALQDEDIRWMPTFFEGVSGGAISTAEVLDIYDTYGDSGAPLVVDDDQEFMLWMGAQGIPSLTLVELDTMLVLVNDDTFAVMEFLNGQYP